MHTKKPKPPLGSVIPLHAVCDEGYCVYCGETKQINDYQMEPCRGPLPLRAEIARLRFLLRMALNPDEFSKSEMMELFGGDAEIPEELHDADAACDMFVKQLLSDRDTLTAALKQRDERIGELEKALRNLLGFMACVKAGRMGEIPKELINHEVDAAAAALSPQPTQEKP